MMTASTIWLSVFLSYRPSTTMTSFTLSILFTRRYTHHDLFEQFIIVL